ncbi:MAG TPA: acyltransferase, partial [Clostridia bacterium]|nr:acyltransferase [Clostridia bacterium]
SGSAIWFAMDRYTTWKFFLERHKRLLLPLVFGMLVVIPPQVYCERLYHHQQFDSIWDFYRTVLVSGPYPEGNMSWHHLWYIPYIWVYSMLLLPLFVWLRSRTGRLALERMLKRLQNPWLLLLIVVPTALSEMILRPFWPGDACNLIDDWANFLHKLTFFATGFVLASGTGVYDSIATHRRKFLVAGVVTLAVLHPIWVGYWHLPGNLSIGFRFLHNFHIWMWILTALGYGRRYLNFNHSFLKHANEAVYPFYILHQTVIVILGYQLVYRDWNIPAKFLVVVTGTFLITWGLYALVIRRWNPLRVVFGMKWIRVRNSDGALDKKHEKGATCPEATLTTQSLSPQS